MTRNPRYTDLPKPSSDAGRVSWRVFGRDDDVGTLNRVQAHHITTAAGLVRQGLVFSLNWSLEQPDPAILGRRTVQRRPFALDNGLDDVYDNFHPQASSQWDSLAHVKHPSLGFYNGRSPGEVTGSTGGRNGIDVWACRGIAGRFVLLDLADHLDLTPNEYRSVTAADLDNVIDTQGVTVRDGDILLLSFGWIDYYEELDVEHRVELAEAGHFPCPGLSPDEAMAAWLWDHGVAAVAGDNPALEAMPFDESSTDTFLHYRLIPMLGMAVGEMFDMRQLVANCRGDRVWEGLFTAAPLNAPGGVGSTANALAMK